MIQSNLAEINNSWVEYGVRTHNWRHEYFICHLQTDLVVS